MSKTVMTATYDDPVLCVGPNEVTWEMAVEAATWALKLQLGHAPSDATLALALGKIFLETGRLRSCWNNNFGNIKASSTYIGMYTAFGCNEVLGGKVVWFSPRGRLDKKGGVVVAEWYDDEPWHPQTRFRAYANHFDGMDQYCTFIATGRYKVAWAKLLSGDANGFVHELKIAGYFTADEAVYAAGVKAIQSELLAKLKKKPAPVIQLPTQQEILACINCDQFAHVPSSVAA